MFDLTRLARALPSRLRDALDAHLEARKAQITLLRLTGNLDEWLNSTGIHSVHSQ